MGEVNTFGGEAVYGGRTGIGSSRVAAMTQTQLVRKHEEEIRLFSHVFITERRELSDTPRAVGKPKAGRNEHGTLASGKLKESFPPRSMLQCTSPAL